MKSKTEFITCQKMVAKEWRGFQPCNEQAKYTVGVTPLCDLHAKPFKTSRVLIESKPK